MKHARVVFFTACLAVAAGPVRAGLPSFGHVIEDAAAALAYLRQPAHAKKLRLDPSRIVLIGHSMGGFMAIQAAAAEKSIP